MKQRSSDEQIPAAVFAVTVAGAFMVALDLSIVNIAFPAITRSFESVSTTTLSWVLSSYSVVFGALLLGAGRVVDRSGRKRSFLGGLAIFTVGSAAWAFTVRCSDVRSSARRTVSSTSDGSNGFWMKS